MDISGSRPYRVLLLHASHTGGHAAAAKALQQALAQEDGVEAESLNLLSLSSSASRDNDLRAHRLVSQTFPELRRLGFKLAFSGSTVACGLAGLALDWKASRSSEVLEGIQQRQPDLVVATHSATARMLNHWQRQGQVTAPVHCVPTDFRTHLMWKQDCIAHYYVAPGGSKADLVGFGVEPERISETGIPIRPPQVSELPRSELRRQLGLDPDKPVVLISGGSLGLQPYKLLVEALRQRPEDFQIVCIAAKNQQARQELEALPQQGQPLKVTGLVDNMGDWIQASDVVLSKPGGLTCSEVLAQGKPMVFAQLYQGLETPLIERMVQAGVALAAPSAEGTAALIGELLASSEKLAQMQQQAQHLARPDSAQTISRHLLGALETKNQAR